MVWPVYNYTNMLTMNMTNNEKGAIFFFLPKSKVKSTKKGDVKNTERFPFFSNASHELHAPLRSGNTVFVKGTRQRKGEGWVRTVHSVHDGGRTLTGAGDSRRQAKEKQQTQREWKGLNGYKSK